MNKTLTNVIDCMKNIKITKRYDSQTSLSCGKCEGEPLTLAMKGDFTVNAIHILAACGIMSTLLISSALVKKLKK